MGYLILNSLFEGLCFLNPHLTPVVVDEEGGNTRLFGNLKGALQAEGYEHCAVGIGQRTTLRQNGGREE